MGIVSWSVWVALFSGNIFLFGLTHIHISKGVSHLKHFLPLCCLSVYSIYISDFQCYVKAAQSHFLALGNVNKRHCGRALACIVACIT